jgi:hypothetical protein
VQNFSTVFTAGDYELQFSMNGAIASLLNTKENVQLAGPTNLLGLFQYTTYDQNDFDDLFEEYFYFDATSTSWASGVRECMMLLQLTNLTDFFPPLGFW